MKETNADGFRAFRSLFDQVCLEHAEEYALKCLRNDGHIQKLKYSRLHFYVEQFAAWKDRLGLRDGDHVMLLQSVSADAVISFFVLAMNHLTVVLADTGIPKDELAELIEETDVRAVFTDKKRFALLPDRDDLPVYQTPGLNTQEAALRDTPLLSGDAAPTPETVAIIFSSGTTAKIKAIQLSYSAQLLCMDILFEKHHLTKKQAEKPILLLFPINHISGLSVVETTILHGLTIACVETMNSATLVQSLKVFAPASFGMVPNVLGILVDKLEEVIKQKGLNLYYQTARSISAFCRHHFGTYKVGRLLLAPIRKKLFGKNMVCISTGGAPAIPSVVESLIDMGMPVVNSYASTECSNPIVTTDWRDRDPVNTVGRIDRDPHVEVLIHNPDDAGIGEIYVKTDYIMEAYYGAPELTKNSFDGEYFKTGDLGYLDKNQYLYMAGRMKDSILLASGKKVSPDDLENMLLPLIGLETEFSVTGVPMGDSGYDTIHLFISSKNLQEETKQTLPQKILDWQHREAKLYPIEEIHFLEALPKTRIGKVKRTALREMVLSPQEETEASAAAAETQETAAAEADVFSRINAIVTECAQLATPLTGLEDLTHDLGIDSLTMMEICTKIEEEFNVFIGSYLIVLPNTREIADYVKDPFFIRKDQNNASQKPGKARTDSFNAFDFPLKRKWIHEKAFEWAVKWSRRRINFQVHGLENVPDNEVLMFCPNHQTHFDGLWTWASLGEKRPSYDSIGCMAKMEHLDHFYSRFFLTVLGGIPVNRTGNTMPSFKRSIEFIREGNYFLIHPEGTRTRTGKLGPFKDGAAQMALEAGVRIIPVAIDGGFAVWPYDRSLPAKEDPATGKKYTIHISFCSPVDPTGKTVDETTAEIRRAIVEKLGEEESLS